jgi:putative Ca2+/H+ antiporter (TMEM165/GDT1 family)
MFTPAAVSIGTISFLVGILLARRFKVLILIPGILLTLIVVTGIGLARSHAAGNVRLSTAVAILGLQLGYTFGLGIWRYFVVIRANRQQLSSLMNALPPRHLHQ